MVLRIYTRTGDKGDTGLFGGGRVPKDDLRVTAYGEVDELNASLGLAISLERDPRIDSVLVSIQKDLFGVGAILATPDLDKMRQQLEKARIDSTRIEELEKAIDEAEEDLEPLTSFILPGGSPKASALHLSRTVCRRAERRVVQLTREAEIPSEIVTYLNRLSDLLFVLARLANHRANEPEVSW